MDPVDSWDFYRHLWILLKIMALAGNHHQSRLVKEIINPADNHDPTGNHQILQTVQVHEHVHACCRQ
jgi:hypothetical protein